MGLSQLIQQPTRVTPNSSTLIDLVFVSKSMGEFQSGVQSVGLSDHSLVYVVTKLKSPKLNPKISTFRSFRFFEEEAFLSDLAAIDWDKTWSQLDNVNQKLDKFLSVYLKLCNKHAPYVTVRRKQKGSPWINDEYIMIARERDYNKKKFDKCKEDTYFERYKYYRNKANNLHKKLKRAYYRKELMDSSVDIRKKWRVLKELLPTKKSNNNSHILRNGEPVNDSYDIATEFNEMFSNIGVVNQNNIDKTRQKENCLSHIQLARSIFCFDEINADFIQNELSNLDCTKSMGLDDLHPRILKISARYIAIPLAHIFNESLCTGIFPQSFKLAKIVPIPKNKLTNDIRNYRRISLLSIVAQIFERAVHSQLLKYIEKEGLMTERQSGFRPNHSTATCLTEICDYLYENFDRGKFVGAAFLDLRKAFDVIPHDILILKLSYFGITDIELTWFKSYLTDRKQCVLYKGETSDFLPVRTGVPQGSILGPLLFCMFMNNMSNLKLSYGTKNSLYASDTAVFYSDFDVKIVQKKLQLDMNKLSKWFSDNGMIVNSDKTKVMLFSSRQKKQNCNFQIYMNGKLLENVDKLKHLGVTIEKSLNWSYHVDDVIKKIVRSIACIRRIKSCLTIDNLKQLNFTLILPYLDYCCTVWGSLTKRDMLRIQKCQNKYARMILNADYNTPSLGLLHTLKWQPVDQRINFHYYVYGV